MNPFFLAAHGLPVVEGLAAVGGEYQAIRGALLGHSDAGGVGVCGCCTLETAAEFVADQRSIIPRVISMMRTARVLLSLDGLPVVADVQPQLLLESTGSLRAGTA